MLNIDSYSYHPAQSLTHSHDLSFKISGPQSFWYQGPVLWRQFFHRWKGVGGKVQVQRVMQAVVSDGEWQMKLGSVSHCSPPAVQPRFRDQGPLLSNISPNSNCLSFRKETRIF